MSVQITDITACKAEKKAIKAGGQMSPPHCSVVNSALNYLAEWRQNLKAGTWRFFNSCAVIVCGHQKEESLTLKIRKAFWRRWHCIWVNRPFGETTKWLWEGEGRHGRGGSHHWCTGHLPFEVTLQVPAGLACIRVSTARFPCRSPPPLTDGRWWINTPVTSTLKWAQLWSWFYIIAQSSL